MGLISCIIKANDRTGKTVFASRDLLRSLRIEDARSIRLTLGSKSTDVIVKSFSTKGHSLRIPTSVARFLKLPFTGKCLLSRQENNEIRVGPLIGMLTASGSKDSSGRRGSEGIKQLMRAGKDRSFVFAFAKNDVDWGNETVIGSFPQPSGGWLRRKVPLPDVVYNRFLNRNEERSSSMDRFKRRLLGKGIPVFNWSFFDKGDVYKWLEGESAYKYIPESIVSPSTKQIKQLVEKYPFIYLKPTHGSAGRGIYRLAYVPKHGYYIRYRHGGKNVQIRYSRFDVMMNMIEKRSNMSRYVAQQGVRLIELDGCSVDFRFHMIKNGNNEWVISGIGAKKAGRGSVTTHVRNGGKLIMPMRLLSGVFGSRAGKVLDNAKKTVIELAEAVERKCPETLGELGLDIGLDRRGNVWMFEANAKPGHTIFKHPSMKSAGRNSWAHLFEHCLYLSKFRGGRGNETGNRHPRMESKNTTSDKIRFERNGKIL
ncbi:YheC/YheD family protein [Paenibacillus hemerocallicola]|uniref:YheC/YheD family protein n=2 Tax=Paenibacillus hemerocallicola TaxID=1172614 RepID=A0A5C4SWC7_9BACL|nr:YheC/YheD family protein [Paenibacillus hemerocallicola]